MLLAMVLMLATVPPQTVPAAKQTAPATKQAAPAAKQAAPAAKATLFDAVAQRMTPEGRPVFVRYVQQVLVPQAREEQAAEVKYRQALRAVVSAPALDVDAAEKLIGGRKQAQAAGNAEVRRTAMAMIKTLPAADRKLALTAIFTDARLPAPAKPKS
jgi:hypothetical protein